MIDESIIKECQSSTELLNLKIKSLEHAIYEAEMMIKESRMSNKDLIFLRRKISSSIQDLETLYLLKNREP